MVVQELVTLLGFEIDDKKLDEMGKKMEDVKKLAFGLGAAVIGAGVAIFGISRTASTAASEVIRLSNATGVATDDIQRMGYVAKLNGSSVEELAMGYKVLGKNIMDVSKNPMGENAKMFRKLGVNVFDANGKIRNANDVFLDLSDRMSKMTNATEKAALAQDLFGKAGGGLVQTLSAGPKRIRELTEEFDAFGGALSREQLETLGSFNDSLDRTFSILGKVRNLVAMAITPTLVEAIDAFRKWLVMNEKIIKLGIEKTFGLLAFILKMVFRSIEMGWKIVSGFFGLFFKGETAVKAMTVILGVLATLITGLLASSIVLLTKMLWGLGVAAYTALAPFLGTALLIGAALAAIVLIGEDIYTFFQGGDSFFGDFAGGLSKFWDGLVENAKARLEEFKSWFVPLVGFLKKAFFDPLKEEIDMLLAPLTSLGGFIKRVLPNSPFAQSGASAVVQRSSPSSMPLPGLGGAGGAPTSVSMQTSIVVPPGTDPVTAAGAVEKGTENAWDSMLRQSSRFGAPSVVR